MIYKKLQFQNYQPSVGTFTEFGRGRSRAGTSTVVSCGERFEMSLHDFTLYVLFPQCRSCNNTLESSFIQMLSYFCAYVCIIHEMT